MALLRGAVSAGAPSTTPDDFAASPSTFAAPASAAAAGPDTPRAEGRDGKASEGEAEASSTSSQGAAATPARRQSNRGVAVAYRNKEAAHLAGQGQEQGPPARKARRESPPTPPPPSPTAEYFAKNYLLVDQGVAHGFYDVGRGDGHEAGPDTRPLFFLNPSIS